MHTDFKLKEILAEAEREQIKIAKEVVTEDSPSIIEPIVIGVDVAYSDDIAVGCAVAFDSETMKVIDTVSIVTEVSFPYISGFFHLREGPVLLKLLDNINGKSPILIDGHGVLHPRRCGLASYVGVMKDMQTIGVAKRPVLSAKQHKTHYGSTLIINGEIVGALLHIDDKRRPIYVSIGHRISIESAVRVVRNVILNGRVEPIHLAHIEAGQLLRESLKC